jgi:hypothetical protein
MWICQSLGGIGCGFVDTEKIITTNGAKVKSFVFALCIRHCLCSVVLHSESNIGVYQAMLANEYGLETRGVKPCMELVNSH